MSRIASNPIVLPEKVERDAVRNGLQERGIQTSVHYPPVHGFSIYAGARAELPVTDAYAARAVTLPLFAHMTREQQDRVIDAVAAQGRGAPTAARRY